MKFTNDLEARQWADQWIAGHLPADVVVQTIGDERAHFERFNADYGRLVGQFEVEYNALAVLIDYYNFMDRSAWPPHRFVQYAMVAYSARTFYSAFDRLVRGYYEDCITLTRTLYETFVRVLFVSCYPDSPYNSLMRNPPKGERCFNLTNFVHDDLGLEWGTKYKIMSVFAHSNSLLVLEALQRAADGRGEPERLGVRYDYEPRLIEAATPFLQFALLGHTRFAIEQLGGTDPPPDTEFLEDAQDSVDLLTYGIRTHAKPYWRRVADDLDLLFRMLPIADASGDWKAFLDDQRDGRCTGHADDP